jgi:hypothetical protein
MPPFIRYVAVGIPKSAKAAAISTPRYITKMGT